MGDAYGWPMPGQPGMHADYLPPHFDTRQADFKRHMGQRPLTAVDMRQLSQALIDAREGTGEVRSVLLRASFKPRLPGLTKMVSKLSKEGAWRKALEVYETVEDLGLIPDTALTNSAISACDKGGRWQKALEVFESMERLGLPRDAITYSATISSLAKGKQWHAALQVFNHMRDAGVPADVVTCCSLINALERGGQWQLAEALFLQMCCVAKDAEVGVVAPRKDGKEEGKAGEVSPSSVFDLLRVLPPPGASSPGGGEVRDAGAPAGEGVPGGEPSDGTADRLLADGEELASRLRSSLSLGDVERATLGVPGAGPGAARAGVAASPFITAASLAAGIRRTGSDAPLRAASASASAFAAPGAGPRIERSVSLSAPHAPRRALSGVHDVQASAHLRRAMTSFVPGPAPGSRADTPTAATVAGGGPGAEDGASSGLPSMGGLSALGSPARAGSPPGPTFAFGHAARVTPNRVCCNALLAAYARARPPQWQRAVHLLRAMWEGGPTLAPDAVSFNTALKACTNAGELDRALEVFKEMGSRGLGHCEEPQSPLGTPWLGSVGTPKHGTHPGPTTALNTLISGYMKSGQYHKVRSFFFDLLGSGQAPSPALMHAMLTACGASGAWADALEAMRAALAGGLEGGLAPGTPLFNAVLAATGNPQQVLAVHDLMLAQGQTPDAAGALTILQSMLQLGEVGKAAFLAHSLLSQGVQLDADVFTSLISACSLLGAWEPAQSLCAAASAAQLASAEPAYNHLLSTALTAGQYNVMVEVLGQMQEARLNLPSAAQSPPSPFLPLGTVPGLNPGPFASIEEANRELEGCIGRLDLEATIHLLTRIQDSGLSADATTYRLLILSASRTDQAHLAVQLCSQAHTLGVFKHYVLPGQSGSGWVNLRDAGTEVGVTSVLTWLTLLSQLHVAGKDLEDETISIVTGADAAGLQLQDSLKVMLTTGQAPLKAFKGLVPLTLPSDALVVSESARGVVSISTRALYRAMPL
ncbi:Pentatricopeptide repeat-containing protein, mitochondrial [Auxenochlorella protothecoides]|uniref:Pentatricopeptide repeat-containing protein, mitochondrial n=1 Tax=Auxenochlorella protothecoides TaxID=3075 RepID=A0A087SFX8_AUXPR|nr:Pentatricopeptide repeat-containing protein, mitochondrial [Auxenochlorella protothecoides]KFM24632.1 Pentatricopeptide repeat-containing protein, mitochondrial [Auxenochlorella protothecoides]